MAEEGDRHIAMPLGHMLFGLSGRIRRRDFWLYSGVNAFGGFVVMAIASVAMFSAMFRTPDVATSATWGSYLLLMVMAPFVWVAVALNIKRLHDIDKSYRWWRINLIPVLGWAWTFFECGLRDGTPGPNRYGLSPKGVGVQSDVF